jgi:hypothetical protein
MTAPIGRNRRQVPPAPIFETHYLPLSEMARFEFERMDLFRRTGETWSTGRYRGIGDPPPKIHGESGAAGSMERIR